MFVPHLTRFIISPLRPDHLMRWSDVGRVENQDEHGRPNHAPEMDPRQVGVGWWGELLGGGGRQGHPFAPIEKTSQD